MMEHLHLQGLHATGYGGVDAVNPAGRLTDADCLFPNYSTHRTLRWSAVMGFIRVHSDSTEQNAAFFLPFFSLVLFWAPVCFIACLFLDFFYFFFT